MNTTLAREISIDVRLAQRERPAGRAIMYQSWRDLLFAHWRMDADLVQSQLPPGLFVDTFDGEAWIGLVPFLMRRIRPWWSPAIPGVSDFQEVNLRTYVVDDQGLPGVWFLSLDANTRLGAWWGRTFFSLPYHYARMSHRHDSQDGSIDYRCRRERTSANLASRFVYRPAGTVRTAEPGSLEFFLVERYVLFAATPQILSGQVSHSPYEICDAQAEVDNELFELNGLPRPERPPDHLLFSRGVDVEIFPLQRPAD